MTHLSPFCVFALETGMLYHLDCGTFPSASFSCEKWRCRVMLGNAQAHQSSASILLYACGLSLPAHAYAAITMPLLPLSCHLSHSVCASLGLAWLYSQPLILYSLCTQSLSSRHIRSHAVFADAFHKVQRAKPNDSEISNRSVDSRGLVLFCSSTIHQISELRSFHSTITHSALFQSNFTFLQTLTRLHE